jgi:hypothetical protein
MTSLTHFVSGFLPAAQITRGVKLKTDTSIPHDENYAKSSCSFASVQLDRLSQVERWEPATPAGLLLLWFLKLLGQRSSEQTYQHPVVEAIRLSHSCCLSDII